MSNIAILLVTYLLVFNIVTTARLIKSDFYTSMQKLFQLLLIWFLPLIGATLISHFLNDEPLFVSKKASKYILFIKFALLPLNIKVKTKIDDGIGNYAQDAHRVFDSGGEVSGES